MFREKTSWLDRIGDTQEEVDERLIELWEANKDKSRGTIGIEILTAIAKYEKTPAFILEEILTGQYPEKMMTLAIRNPNTSMETARTFLHSSKCGYRSVEYLLAFSSIPIEDFIDIANSDLPVASTLRSTLLSGLHTDRIEEMQRFLGMPENVNLPILWMRRILGWEEDE